MSVITKKYDNGVERNLTVISAQYCNPANDAVIVITEESGAVLISQISSPDLWQQLNDSGVSIAAYVQPEQPTE